MNIESSNQENINVSLLEDEHFFNEMRQKEFARLEQTGHCYLDYTGANLYPQSLLDRHFDFMKNEVYGNPHSTNPTSQLATNHVAATREQVLQYFGAEDAYICIFTANASEALHIIGESFPFDKESQFLYSADNHNSVIGIREYCRHKGGSINRVQLNFEDLLFNQQSIEDALSNNTPYSNKLFAFPAQSNVSGNKHDLKWIAYAQAQGWDVLLDVAAFVPSSKLDLKTIQPDFVTVSFYKIFGYPTGLGCLLVKKEKFQKLVKPWFAGGTVNFVSVNYESFILADNYEKFENGTVNFLGIPAISFGLYFIESIGIERIHKRVKSLSKYFKQQAVALTHSNGNPLFKFFGTSNLEQKGATFIFNFLDDEGHVIYYDKIEEKANQQKISLRSGCFCNPGIDEANNCLTPDELAKYFTSGHKGGLADVVAFMGKIRGALRVSFGLATIKADIDRFLEFALSYKDYKSN